MTLDLSTRVKMRDSFLAQLRTHFPLCGVFTYLHEDTQYIEVLLKQQAVEYTLCVPITCDDPYTYIRQYYPEFFI